MTPKAPLALLLLALAGAVHAQEPAPQPAASSDVQAAPPGIPPELQARIEAAETRDYRAERMAMANAPGFDGYALAVREQGLLEEWFTLVEDGKSTLAQQEALIERLSRELPLSYYANAIIMRWYAERHEASSPPDPLLLERGRPYFLAAEGIMASITGSGDGRSEDTAWQVIHIGEEYMALNYLEYKVKDQGLVIGDDGKPFDVFTVTDAEGKERTVYFDISAFFGKGVD